MAIKTFPKAPYYNNFDEKNNFVQILFRPELAVQVREINAMQSMAQSQLAHLSNHILQNKTVVKDGELTIDKTLTSIKIADSAVNGSPILNILPNLVGMNVVNEATKSYGTIVYYSLKDSAEGSSYEIFIKYIGNTDSSSTEVTNFKTGDILQISNPDGEEYENIQLKVSSEPSGAVLASIKEGVFYVNGFYVYSFEQKYVVSNVTSKPNCRVGLRIVEEIITPEIDNSLLDNASGTPNYSASGAHRYKMSLTLTSIGLDDSDELFVEIARMENGEVIELQDKTQYADLMKTVARRTYDTNGDFTVTPFIADIREHRTNIRGEWTANTPYLINDCITSNGVTFVALNDGTSGLYSSPTTSNLVDNNITWKVVTNATYNNGIFSDGEDNAIAFGLEAGKAYVRGYEIEKKSIKYLKVEKPSSTNYVNNAVINVNIGNYVALQSFTGIINPFEVVGIYSDKGATEQVGTAIALNIEPSINSYNLYLMDVKMNEGHSFSSNVQSFKSNSFKGIVNPIFNNYTGNFTVAGSSVTGTSISFLMNFKVNDYLLINNLYCKIISIEDDYSLTIDRSDIEGIYSIQKVTALLKETSNNKLYFDCFL